MYLKAVHSKKEILNLLQVTIIAEQKFSKAYQKLVLDNWCNHEWEYKWFIILPLLKN